MRLGKLFKSITKKTVLHRSAKSFLQKAAKGLKFNYNIKVAHVSRFFTVIYLNFKNTFKALECYNKNIK